MSRIGLTPILIPEQTKATIEGNGIFIAGPKGEIRMNIPSNIKVHQEENKLIVSDMDKKGKSKALHGLVRALLNNHIIGVTKGFEKTLGFHNENTAIVADI